MTEKAIKAGRKALLIMSVFFLGVVISPPGWNFWDFLAEVSENPEIMKSILYCIAGFVVMSAILYIIGQLKKE